MLLPPNVLLKWKINLVGRRGKPTIGLSSTSKSRLKLHELERRFNRVVEQDASGGWKHRDVDGDAGMVQAGATAAGTTPAMIGFAANLTVSSEWSWSPKPVITRLLFASSLWGTPAFMLAAAAADDRAASTVTTYSFIQSLGHARLEMSPL